LKVLASVLGFEAENFETLTNNRMNLGQSFQYYGGPAPGRQKPKDPRLKHFDLLTQSRRCQDWFENKLRGTILFFGIAASVQK